ncbi:hypothetical protein NIES2098_64690 [Calothrix sp. NIES-2098]|nr:hypothetical protein NIES2098_64690 [Calothrix sp. NIES-2098]
MKTLAKWSIDDYHRMIEAGILRDRYVELLAGEIVEMSPETPIHYTTAKRGAKYLEELLSSDVRVSKAVATKERHPFDEVVPVRVSVSKGEG